MTQTVLTVIGWFVIGVLFARRDRRTDLPSGMEQTLHGLRDVAEAGGPAANSQHADPSTC